MSTSGYVLPAYRKMAAAAKAALGPTGDDFADEKMFPSLAPSANVAAKPKMNYGSVVKERIRLDEEEEARIAGWDEMNPTNMTDAELAETGWAKLRLPSEANRSAWYSAIVRRMTERDRASELQSVVVEPWSQFESYNVPMAGANLKR